MGRTKQDRARVSIRQAHEIFYVKRMAERTLARLKKFKGTTEMQVIKFDKIGSGEHTIISSVSTIRKICKAFLKITKKR